MPSTVTKLREFLGNHEALEAFSSQKGFGSLIGRSDAFVRGLEKSPASITQKVANLIEARVGVSSKWLVSGDHAEGILAKDGGVLTHDQVISCVQAQTDKNLRSIANRVGRARLKGSSSSEKIVNATLEVLREMLLDDQRPNRMELLHGVIQLIKVSEDSVAVAHGSVE